LPSPSSSHLLALQKKEEGNDNVVAIAFLPCNIAKVEEEGNGVVAVAFFATLRYNAAPQEEEEGDDNCHCLFCYATTQCNSTRGKRRR